MNEGSYDLRCGMLDDVVGRIGRGTGNVEVKRERVWRTSDRLDRMEWSFQSPECADNDPRSRFVQWSEHSWSFGAAPSSVRMSSVLIPA